MGVREHLERARSRCCGDRMLARQIHTNGRATEVKPICVLCQRFMRCKKTGFCFLEGMPSSDWDGKRGKDSLGWVPYKLWVGDLFECPDCGAQTISGMNREPIAEHYQSGFTEMVLRTGADRLMIKDC